MVLVTRRERDARVPAVLLLLSAVGMGGGCRQLADIEPQPACQEPVSDEATCQSCERTECCDETIDCLADEQCVGASKCIDACTSSECRAACSNELPTLARLESCRARRCEKECGLQCGGYPFASSACAACANQACCIEAADCGKSSDCRDLARCEHACSRNDQACRAECEYRYPAGLEAARALALCTSNSCAGSCAAGVVTPDWSCDATSAAFAPSELGFSHTITIGLLPNPAALAAVQAIVLAEVRACPPAIPDGVYWTENFECAQQVGPTEKTNLGGTAVLNIPPDSDYFVRVEGGQPYEPGPVGMQSFLLYAPPPQSEVLQTDVLQLSTDAFRAVYAKVATVNPERGHLRLHVVDCSGNDAPGVSYYLASANPDAVPFYGRFADVPGFETIADDSEGGFLNLDAPQAYTVTARRRDTGNCVSRRRVIVNPGFETIVSPMVPGGCPKDEK
jgi:hypothetical protein